MKPGCIVGLRADAAFLKTSLMSDLPGNGRRRVGYMARGDIALVIATAKSPALDLEWARPLGVTAPKRLPPETWALVLTQAGAIGWANVDLLALP